VSARNVRLTCVSAIYMCLDAMRKEFLTWGGHKLGEVPVIETRGLSKSFRVAKKVVIQALSDVSLKVRRGEIFGVLGPNGAGKTTMIRILTTLLWPTSGDAWICGYSVRKSDYDVRKRIGVAFGPEMLYRRLTGRDNLRFYGKMYGVENLNERIAEIASVFGISDRLDSLVETYSLGMRCKLALSRCLLNDPDVIFLDEPTLGLDPTTALTVRRVIKELRQQGKTIMISTHYMKEAEEVCDRVVFLFRGRAIRVGTPDDLVAGLKAPEILTISFERVSAEVIEYAESVGGQVKGNGRVRIPLARAVDLQKVLSDLASLGAPIASLRIDGPSLEEVFLKLAQHG